MSQEEERPQVPVDEEVEEFTNLSDLPPDLLEKAMAILSSKAPVKEIETIEASGDDIIAVSTEGPWANTLPVDVKDGRNNRKLVCPFCRKSVILLSGAATHIQKEMFLAFPNAAASTEGRIYNDFFKVTSKMDFENIGVRRPVEGEPYRYLTCADCDMGPLGITYDADNNKVFYVSHDRVKYA